MESSAPPDDVTVVVDALRYIVNELRLSTYRAEDEAGISGAQLFVLRELSQEPGISIRRLSERTLTDPSSVSVIVANLVERGFITRRRDPEDARKSVLSVSAKGRNLLAWAPEPFQVRLFAALHELSPGKLRHLRDGLTCVLEKTALASAGKPPLFFEGGRIKMRKRREA